MSLRPYALLSGIAATAARGTRSSSARSHRGSAGAPLICEGECGRFARDPSQTSRKGASRLGGRHPSMGYWREATRWRRGIWALSEPSAVLLWQCGMAWSSLAAVVDAATGRHSVLSGLVLLGPACVFFTGRWLRTALAGAWATCLIVALGIPDGIWGSRLEALLITSAVLVAVVGTLALVITVRACLSLTVSASLAAACGSPSPPLGRPSVSVAKPVSCRQQYERWKDGPGLAQYRRVKADASAVRAVERSENAVALRSAMKKLEPAVVANGNLDPLPRCADPAGLYATYMTEIYMAGSRASSARGLSGLRKAAASLNDVKRIESRLAAEANRALARG
jgi:hypothetical protein